MALNTMPELLAVNDFEVPPSMMINEFNSLAKAFNIQNGVEQSVIDSVKNLAIRNSKKRVILDAIYNHEGLEISPIELDNLLGEQAKINGKEKSEFVSFLYNSGQMDSFIGVLRNRKTVEFLINQKGVSRERS